MIRIDMYDIKDQYQNLHLQTAEGTVGAPTYFITLISKLSKKWFPIKSKLPKLILILNQNLIKIFVFVN
jgi:hypothetical protein